VSSPKLALRAWLTQTTLRKFPAKAKTRHGNSAATGFVHRFKRELRLDWLRLAGVDGNLANQESRHSQTDKDNELLVKALFVDGNKDVADVPVALMDEKENRAAARRSNDGRRQTITLERNQQNGHDRAADQQINHWRVIADALGRAEGSVNHLEINARRQRQNRRDNRAIHAERLLDGSVAHGKNSFQLFQTQEKSPLQRRGLAAPIPLRAWKSRGIRSAITDRNRIPRRDWQNIPKIDKYIMTQLWQTCKWIFSAKIKKTS